MLRKTLVSRKKFHALVNSAFAQLLVVSAFGLSSSSQLVFAQNVDLTTTKTMLEVSKLQLAGKMPEAEALCAKELARLRATKQRTRNLAQCELGMAELLSARKQYGQAEAFASDAVNLYAQIDGDPSLSYLTSSSVLAKIYEAQSKWAKAEPIVAKLMGAYKSRGESDFAYIMVQQRYANIVAHIAGRQKEGEELKARVKETEERTEPSEDISKIGMEGLRARIDKDYKKAEALLGDAFAKAKAKYGESDTRFVEVESALAGTYVDDGKYAQAEPLLRHAYEFRKKENSAQVGLMGLMYSNCLKQLGKFALAESVQQSANQANIKSVSATDPRLAASLQKMNEGVSKMKQQANDLMRKQDAPYGGFGSSNPLDEQVRINMYSVSLSAQMYSLDHDGYFPAAVDMGLISYFSDGGNDSKKAGKPMKNPFTKQDEWPVTGKFYGLERMRAGRPGPLRHGVIEYSVAPDRRSFAIRGGGANNLALPNLVKGTFVISK